MTLLAPAKLQRASDVKGGIPLRSSRVLFVRVDVNGAISTANTVTGKRDLLATLAAGSVVLACWPGQWKQDAFLLDDVRAAQAALT